MTNSREPVTESDVRNDPHLMLMIIKFTLTAGEFLESQKIFSRSLAPTMQRLNYRYAVPAGVVLLVEGVLGFVLRWNLGICLAILIFGAYLIFGKTIIGPRSVRKEFSQNPDLVGERSMQFSENTISVQTSHGKGETDWARLTRFIETDRLFVLFAPPRFLFTVPKRVLSPDEFHQFRDLLTRKLVSER